MTATTETTRHYVLVDLHTGFAWEETDATSPIAACQQIDTAMGEGGRSYEEHGPQSGARRSGQSGYLVYVAPASWVETTDGQDQAQIERVENECELVACVTFNENN